MATRKKSVNKDEIEAELAEDVKIQEFPEDKLPEFSEKQEEQEKPEEITPKSKIKYEIGSIVYISKDADADLNGFKLFPPYKKYTYTVEAYDEISDVYSLRRLNLSLKLKENDIVAPSERAHDSLNRKQF